jgi:hypothetical protein
MTTDDRDDRDDRIDELLREALQEEADTVVPSGDGLSRIQGRVRSDRSRQRWTRPAFVLGSVALLAAAGVGVYAATNGSGDSDRLDAIESGSPSPSTSESVSPSPTNEPVSNTDFPRQAIFPFTTAEEENAWEASYAQGHEPWKADPEAVAQFWVQNYLGEKDIDETVSKTLVGDRARVTLGRTLQVEQQAQIPITTVRLVQYGKGWVVVGAVDPQGLLSLSSPTPGATVTSPVTVTGPGYGVDEAAAVKVFDSSEPGALGVEHVSYGSGTQEWSTSLSYDAPKAAVGAVVAVQGSAADGGPQRLVAQQVRFGAATGGEAPAYFYAVKDNRIAKFASRNGAALEYLTEEQPGGGPSDPQVGGTTGLVYYLEGSGTCSNALVALDNEATHHTHSVASPDSGYVITGYSVLESEGAETNSTTPAVAYYEQACDSQTSPQAKLVMRTWNGTTHTVKFPSQPPAITGDPSWEADGTHVVAYVRTGNDGYLARYDATSGKDATPGAVCGDDAPDGMPTALEIDSTADMWVALQTGSAMTVATCGGGAWHEQFSIPGNDTPADADVTADGAAVLLTDADGKVWRWDGSGEATELSPSVPLDHITW